MSSIFDNLDASVERSVQTMVKPPAGENNKKRIEYFEMPTKKDGTPYEKLVLEEGVNKFDILPFRFSKGFLMDCEIGKVDYKVDVEVLRKLGASFDNRLSLRQIDPKDEDRKRAYFLAERDPITEYMMEMYQTARNIHNKEENKSFWSKYIAPYRGQRRCLYVVLHHQKDGKRVPKIFEAAHFSFEKMLAGAVLKQKALGTYKGNFSNPLMGYTLAVWGEKKLMGEEKHEFVAPTSIDFVERDKPLAKTEEEALQLISTIPSLDAFLNIPTVDILAGYLTGFTPKVKEETFNYTPPTNPPISKTTVEAPAKEVTEEELVF